MDNQTRLYSITVADPDPEGVHCSPPPPLILIDYVFLIQICIRMLKMKAHIIAGKSM